MKKLKQEPTAKNSEEELKIEQTDEQILLQIKKRKEENDVLKKLLKNLNDNNKKVIND